MKNSLVLYTDYLQHIKDLTLEQTGQLFLAILHYQNGDDVPELDAVTKMAFNFISFQMDKDNEKYEKTTERRREAGKMGGRPKANGFEENQEKAKKANGFFEKQTKAKKPDNDNVNDNDNVLKEISPNGDKEKPTTKHFVPPTRQEVTAYCEEKGYKVDVERFVDYYTSNGWMVGKNKMKDWKAAVRNWNRGQRQGVTTKGNNTFNQFEQNRYDFDSLESELLANR